MVVVVVLLNLVCMIPFHNLSFTKTVFGLFSGGIQLLETVLFPFPLAWFVFKITHVTLAVFSPAVHILPIPRGKRPRLPSTPEGNLEKNNPQLKMEII